MNDRLAEKLAFARLLGGADSHAHADFPGALVHGHEHYVHDPMPPTNRAMERYWRESSIIRAESAMRWRSRLDGDIEIIGLAGADVVALAEQIGDFPFSLREASAVFAEAQMSSSQLMPLIFF